MSFTANHPATRQQAKIMNRFELTKRMVARLKQNEAVIGGIGYTNFDLWAAGRRPENSTCWAAWGWPARSRWASRWHSRSDR